LGIKAKNGSFDEFTERCFEFVGRFTQAGSGILDMIARCKQAGLPAPEFRQEGGQFARGYGDPTRQSPRKSPRKLISAVTCSKNNHCKNSPARLA